MSAVAQAPVPTPVLRTKPWPTQQHIVLHQVSWPAYVAIGNALLYRPGLRMTFDRGTLEIMTTSRRHEFYKKWLDRLIWTIAEARGLPVDTAGNMTFQREDLSRAIEGDDCYWIAHEPQMRGKRTWDPPHDPPPDLILEIEISRSALDRMQIYAALRVPEVWCFDGDSLRVYHLQSDGTYQVRNHSLAFPGVPLAGIAPFLQPSETVDALSTLRVFREWLRGLPS